MLTQEAILDKLDNYHQGPLCRLLIWATRMLT
jgi:hypothetical protein